MGRSPWEIEHWKKAILNASSASDSSVSTSEIYFAGSVATMSSASHAPSSPVVAVAVAVAVVAAVAAVAAGNDRLYG